MSSGDVDPADGHEGPPPGAADPVEDIVFLAFDLVDRLTWHFQNRAAELGLTRVEGTVLIHLVPGRAVAMNDLAQRTRIDPANLSRVVSRLESRELVVRPAGTADRRVRQVGLTTSGTQLRARLRQLATIGNPVTTGLTARQRRTLHHLLRQLAGVNPPD